MDEDATDDRDAAAPRGRRGGRLEILQSTTFATLLVQFLVTTVAGSILLFLYQEDLRRRETLDARIVEFQQLMEIAAERRERGDLVRSSICRNAAVEELQSRKTAYDDAYIEYNGALVRNLMELKIGFGSDGPNLIENATERYLSTWFSKFDDCITDAYDAAQDPFVSEQAQAGAYTSFHCPFREDGRYSREAWYHLSGCRRAMYNQDYLNEKRLSVSALSLSRDLQRCTDGVAEAAIKLRELGTRFTLEALLQSPETKRAEQAAVAEQLDAACGLERLQAFFPCDPKFAGALNAYSPERAASPEAAALLPARCRGG
ncbi:MAG: hypothetical protein AAF909_13230 [Pseudomonadota bacterium]